MVESVEFRGYEARQLGRGRLEILSPEGVRVVVRGKLTEDGSLEVEARSEEGKLVVLRLRPPHLRLFFEESRP